MITTNGILHDPHIWLDPFLWADGIDHLGLELAKDYPEFSEEIVKNKKSYTAQFLKKELS